MLQSVWPSVRCYSLNNSSEFYDYGYYRTLTRNPMLKIEPTGQWGSIATISGRNCHETIAGAASEAYVRWPWHQQAAIELPSVGLCCLAAWYLVNMFQCLHQLINYMCRNGGLRRYADVCLEDLLHGEDWLDRRRGQAVNSQLWWDLFSLSLVRRQSLYSTNTDWITAQQYSGLLSWYLLSVFTYEKRLADTECKILNKSA